jgi:hypothetical protein
MHLIFLMATNQRLKIVHTKFYDIFKNGATPNSKGQLLVDDVAKKIYVNLRSTMLAVSRAMLPHPDYDAAVRSFAAAASTVGFEQGVDGFVIDQAYWDSEAAKWRKSR